MKWIPAFLLCLWLGIGAGLRAQDLVPLQYGYLLESITIPSGKSVLSFPPATRVIIQSETEAGDVAASVSGHALTLKSSQITRDSSVAQALLTKMAEEKRGAARLMKKPGEKSMTAAPDDSAREAKLGALQKQAAQVQAQMERIQREMKNTPHKPVPRTPMDVAYNNRHEELKRQLEDLRRQHEKIMEQERPLKRELKQ